MTGTGTGTPQPAEEVTGDSATLPGDSRTRTEEDSRQPVRIGRFAVIERIGEGGMGVVYSAFDPQLDRKIAVKLVRGGEATGGSKSDAQTRLLREARAMAKLSHPNVVTVHDVGTHDGQVYIAMEFVEGSTLTTWLEVQPRSEREIIDTFVRAGQGLAAAHAAGMVHRDFKSDNVLVGEDGRVRVMDFGIVRASKGDPGQTGRFEALSAAELDQALEPVTQKGALVGTPAYMAPEQLLSSDVDARADQFSFCVALYEALYGERPFAGTRLGQLAFHVIQGKVRDPPKGSRVSMRVRRLLLRGLKRRREERYPSLEELLAELSKDPARARRRWLISAAVGVIGAGAAWGYTSIAGDPGRSCRAGAAAMDAVWNPGRRDAIAGAFEATQVPFGVASLETVAAVFDGRARAWRAMWEQACDATHEGHRQSAEMLQLRLDCLHELEDEQAALVEEFAQADAKTVEKAVMAVANLSPLERCDDERRLRNQIEAPSEAETADRVRALRKQLLEARAKAEAGKSKEADALVRAVVDEAQGLGYQPLLAEALSRHGDLLGQLGEYDEAYEVLKRATWLSVAVGHDEQVCASATRLASLLGTRMARYDEALLWAEHAMACTERLGGLGRLDEAQVLHARGGIYRQSGHYEQAKQDLERAIEIRAQFLGEDHLVVAASLNNLGNALALLDQLDAAQAAFERALAIFVADHGNDHPLVGAGYNNLGQLLILQGKIPQAREAVETSIEVWTKTLGPDHPNLSHPLNSLGVVLFRLGEDGPALAALERAFDLAVEAHGLDHPNVATTRENLAGIFHRMGRDEEALKHAELGLPVIEKRYGRASAEAGSADLTLGEILLALGRAEEAETAIQTAVEVTAQARGADHGDNALPLAARGALLTAQGKFAEARADLERAVELAKGEPDLQVLANCELAYAHTLLAEHAGSPDGIAAARRARALFERPGIGNHWDLAEVDALLAAGL